MPNPLGSKGFSLIEFIAILILLAIIAVVAISRVMNTSDTDVLAKVDVLKSHIRYVQFRAMHMSPSASAATTCKASFGVSISADSYFMFRDCDTSSRIFLPGASDDVISVPNMNLTAAVLTFDNWGRPCTDVNGSTLAVADINLGRGILIRKNTGFIE